MEVSSPPGAVIGSIQQQWSVVHPRLLIKNELGDPVLKIEGPCWTCSCGGDVEFNVLSVQTGEQVGVVCLYVDTESGKLFSRLARFLNSGQDSARRHSQMQTTLGSTSHWI